MAESEEGPSQQSKGKEKRDPRLMEYFGEKLTGWFFEQPMEVGVEELTFDSEAAEGQIRVLDKAAVAERVKSFQNVEPKELLDCTLWEADLAGLQCVSSLDITHLICHRHKEGGHLWPAQHQSNDDHQRRGHEAVQGAEAMAGEGQGPGAEARHPPPVQKVGCWRQPVPAEDVHRPQALRVVQVVPPD